MGGIPRSKTLVVQNLVKIYEGASEPALNGLSISVDAGDVFGLLGPNGAGKTTAVSVMNTLLKPTSGTVHICGIDAVKYPGHARKLIGYVPQEIALYSNLTARENLFFLGKVYGLRGKELDRRVAECIEIVGLEDSADNRVFTYSGGMKRRANLAAGILHKPRLLFLDEPTVGIDPQSRNLILERLLAMKNATTMIYTTHYLSEAESLCSFVAIMDTGRIVAEGTPEELMQKVPGCTNLESFFIALTGKQLRD